MAGWRAGASSVSSVSSAVSAPRVFSAISVMFEVTSVGKSRSGVKPSRPTTTCQSRVPSGECGAVRLVRNRPATSDTVAMTRKTRSAATRPARSERAVKSRWEMRSSTRTARLTATTVQRCAGMCATIPSTTAPTANNQARRLRRLSPPASTSIAPAAKTAAANTEPLTTPPRARGYT